MSKKSILGIVAATLIVVGPFTPSNCLASHCADGSGDCSFGELKTVVWECNKGTFGISDAECAWARQNLPNWLNSINDCISSGNYCDGYSFTVCDRQYVTKLINGEAPPTPCPGES